MSASNDEDRRVSMHSAYEFCNTAFRLALIAFFLLVAYNAWLVPHAAELDDWEGHLYFITSQLNFDDEGNLATWASSILLILAALGCFALSLRRSMTNSVVSKLLVVMGLGFILLSLDDVAEIHNYVEDVIAGVDHFADDDAPETPESEAAEDFDSMIGPVFAGLLAAIFGLVFLLPLVRTARPGSAKFLIFCFGCVALVSLTEFIYQSSSCEEDWCFLLSSLFEESFEFLAIFLFLAFLRREIFYDAYLEGHEEAIL